MGKIRITFWGVRGSVPSSCMETKRYGGNTSCVEVVGDGERIICDAGTGIRPLGIKLQREFRGRKKLRATILLTHLHWDHILGLPFFAPIHEPRHQIAIYGYAPPRQSLRRLLTQALSAPYFPVTLAHFEAKPKITRIDTRPIKLGRVMARPVPVHHPGGAVGWQLTFRDGKRVVYVSDNELGAGNYDALLAAATEADCLIHDAQYTAAEYRQRRGWGHSSILQVIKLAQQARVKNVVLFHHDPERSDGELSRIGRLARIRLAKGRAGIRLIVAREGASLII